MSDRSSQPMHALSVMGVVTLFMTLLGWSSIPLFLKHFAGSMDAWTANGWRYGFSAILWLPVIVFGFMRRTLPDGIWKAAIVPSIFNITGQAAFAWAPYFIGAGLMTFGLRTQIIFVALGAYLLFPSERRVLRSPAFLGALVVVFAGAMGTLILAEPAASTDAVPQLFGHELTRMQATLFGTALSVASGALFAGYALAVRHYMHGMHPVTAFAAICQYTGIGLVILMLPLAHHAGVHDFGASVIQLSGRELWLLAISAIIGIALGHVFYYTSIAKLGVAVSSGVIQLQPIIVAVGSYFLFGEVLSAWQWACGSVAVAAAMVMLGVQHRLSRADAIAARAAAEIRTGPAGAETPAGKAGQPVN